MQMSRGMCSRVLNKVRYSVGIELGRWDKRLEVNVGRGHILTGSAWRTKELGLFRERVTEQVRGQGQMSILDHCGTCGL